MKKSLILPLLLPIVMTGCGGGGSDDKTNPAQGKNTAGKGADQLTVSEDFPNLPNTSRWAVEASSETDSCGESSESVYELQIDYSLADKSVAISVDSFGYQARDINLIDSSESSITFSGVIEDDEGVTELKSVVLNFQDLNLLEEGGATITGTSSWSWSDEEESCDGTSELSGVLIPAGDQNPDVPPTATYTGSVTYTIGTYTGNLNVEAAEFGNDLVLNAYVDADDLDPNASIFTIEELSMEFISFKGAGEYSSSSNEEAGPLVELAYSHSEFSRPSDGEEIPMGGKEFYCSSTDDEDFGVESLVSASVTENEVGFSGAISGSVACVLTDQAGEEASSSEVISIEFSLQNAGANQE